MFSEAVRLGAVGPRPPAPASQARLRGGLHSKTRDRAAISHHYDLSNDFYRRLLDDTMAYSCGYRTGEEPALTPADAQRAKLELICRKLGLVPGARLLDIGCGWGSLTLYAAQRPSGTGRGSPPSPCPASRPHTSANRSASGSWKTGWRWCARITGTSATPSRPASKRTPPTVAAPWTGGCGG